MWDFISLTIMMVTVGSLAGFFISRILGYFITLSEKRILRLLAYLLLGIPNLILTMVTDENILYVTFFFFLGILLCFRGTFLEKFSMFLLFYPILLSLDIIMTFCYFFLFGEYFLPYALSVLVFWYLLFRLMRRYYADRKIELESRSWVLIDLISLATTVIMLGVSLLLSIRYIALILIGAAVTIVTHVGILLLVHSITEYIQNQADLKQMRMQQSYYAMLESEQQLTRKIRHDINNHMQIINGLILQQDYEKAQDYLNSISDSLNAAATKNYVNQPVVNLVLNQKVQRMEEKQIASEIEIHLDSDLSVTDMDLCSMFSNLLDNAIEACEKIPEPSKRFIHLRVRTKHGFLSCSVHNSKAGASSFDGKIYRTSKKDSKNHGYGLSNLQDLVTRYHGTLDIQESPDEFSVVFILPQ